MGYEFDRFLRYDELSGWLDGVAQARPELVTLETYRLADDAWRVEAGIANTGWLPTDVSALARNGRLTKPILVEITSVDAIELIDGPARRTLGDGGQLEGRAASRFRQRNDGTPDRALVSWVVRTQPGTRLTIAAIHDRSGRVSVDCSV